MMNAPGRFQIPPENALSIAGNADGLLKALLKLEAHQECGNIKMAEFTERLPAKPQPESQEERLLKGARTALFDRLAALRQDVANLLADAERIQGRDPGEMPDTAAVDPPSTNGLPAPLALRALEKWYAKGIGTYLRKAGKHAERLLQLVPEVDQEETRVLRAGLQELLDGVRGPKSD